MVPHIHQAFLLRVGILLRPDLLDTNLHAAVFGDVDVLLLEMLSAAVCQLLGIEVHLLCDA